MVSASCGGAAGAEVGAVSGMPAPLDRLFGGHRDQRPAKRKPHSAAQQSTLQARYGAAQRLGWRRIEPHIAGCALSLWQELAARRHDREQHDIPVTGKEKPEP